MLASGILMSPRTPVTHTHRRILFLTGYLFFSRKRHSYLKAPILAQRGDSVERNSIDCINEYMQQTVKELVDNAVDACRPRVGPPWRRIEDQDPPTVKVVLRRVLRSHRSSSNGPIGVDGTEAGSPGERNAYPRTAQQRTVKDYNLW